MEKITQVLIPFTILQKKVMVPKNPKTVKELQANLQTIFEESDHQNVVLAKIYRLVFPDWEQIERIEGFPQVGQALWKYICNLFIEFDRDHHPGVLNGGAWINQGFSSNPDLGPWEINLQNCTVIYS